MVKLIVKIILLTFVFFLLLALLTTFRPYEETIPKQKITADKGIYITANVARLPSYFKEIRLAARASGFNTIVLDVNELITQPIFKLAKEKKLSEKIKLRPNIFLAKLTKQLHDEGFIVSARLVVFKDSELAEARPDLAIKLKKGRLYRDFMKESWLDPYSREAQLYKALLAEVAALSGVDEVQFDYIRFPNDKVVGRAVFPFENKAKSRIEVIASFLKLARKRLAKYKTSIAIDIFGVTAWQDRYDTEPLGQDIEVMSKYVDVISPMFYPSHFHDGYDGFDRPGEYPYYFIGKGLERAKRILGSSEVKLVPWLQGFDLQSPNFGPQYILDQVEACHDENIKSFLVWNPRNDYTVTFNALKK